jgi:hypothetical protein
LPFVGPAVVAIVIEPAALGAPRAIVIVRPLAAPPRLSVAAVVLTACLLPLFVMPSTSIEIFHR